MSTLQEVQGDNYCAKYSRWPDGSIITFANNVEDDALKAKLSQAKEYESVTMDEENAFGWFNKKSKSGQTYQYVLRAHPNEINMMLGAYELKETGKISDFNPRAEEIKQKVEQKQQQQQSSSGGSGSGFNTGGYKSGGKSGPTPFVYTNLKFVPFDLENGWSQGEDGFNAVKNKDGIPILERINNLATGEVRFLLLLGKRKYL